MGEIPSISLPSIVTCKKCDCHNKCYANKLERLRPNVRNAYARNLEIYLNDPDWYWREVEGAIMMSRFFRFHVSGDIPDYSYFVKMVEVASRNPHCEILCFTKKYELVNNYWFLNQNLPKNLHIIFSGWVGLQMVNPFSFPEAHVRFKDGITTAREDAIECLGNCSECAKTNEGCWVLKPGQQVIFNEQ